MRYRNVKTGVILDTPCLISGNGWQEETSASIAPEEETEADSGEAEEEPEEPKAEQAEEKKEVAPVQQETVQKETAKGAVIKPKKGK
ncbi:MAG: hypothetical protein IJ600_03480 [Lachnospiraceae bacterium]|nr:hypothetical protein [Lachnospiraceae bacterium]